MKEESVLSVLMYLFKHHMHNNCQLDLQNKNLLPQLEEAGFKRQAIVQALGWLANLTEADFEFSKKNNNHSSLRVFNDYEMERLDVDCRGFILGLEQQDILNPFTRELVINQVLELETEGVDLGLIKWVTLMVLYNQPEEEKALSSMEMLVLGDEMFGEEH